MANRFKKIIICLLVLALSLIGICGCNKKDDAKKIDDVEPVVAQFTINNDAIETKQFGSIVLDCFANDFLETFSYSDVVSVEFEGKDALRIPVCGEYDDVSPGELVIRANPNDNKVIININYGQLGMQLGYIEINAQSNEFKYRIVSDKFPSGVTIRLLEKGGYADRIAVGKLKSSNERTVYAQLSDEEFCNFREITLGSIVSNKLYRSSSPIDDSIGRNAYVDAIIEDKGVNTIINMTDDVEEGTQFSGYNETYYSTTTVGFLKMSLAFKTQEFDDSIIQCIRFINANDGPYLIHCVYGKDRTGFLCALLEALCGASITEIKADYVKTYENLFDVQEGAQVKLSDEIKNVIGNIIIENMSYAYGVSITENNIQMATVDYLLQIGLLQTEIDTLISQLSTYA